MKTFIWILLLMAMPALAQRGAAQKDSTIYVNHEKMPRYPLGERQLKLDTEAYMEARLRQMFPQAHPDSLATDEVRRRIIVQFVIDEEGRVKEPSVIRGLHPVLDEEAVCYVRQLRRFEPGSFDGKPWSVRFVLPLFVHPYYLRLLERGEYAGESSPSMK